MMDIIEITAVYWFVICLPITVVLCGLVWWFGRKRVQWNLLDYSVSVVPFFIWGALYVHGYVSGYKNLINVFNEPVLLAILAPLAPLLRVLFQSTDQARQKRISLLGLGLITALGIVIWAVVPPVGEK